MRAWIFICAVFTLSVAPLYAQLEWKRQVIGYNATLEQESVTALYHFRNEGTTPVEILAMKSSCGCTVPELEKKIYEPGEAGTIRVKFSFEGRTGPQEKRVQVTTTDPVNPITVLVLNVNIPLFVSVEPQLIFWTRGETATPKTAVITVQGENSIEILSANSSSDSFEIELSTVEKGRSYILTVIPKSTDVAAQGKIELLSNVGTESPRKVHVALQVY
jgi:hypothetical protein